MEQKKIGWRWLSIIGAVLFGSLLLMMILPNTGYIYDPALVPFTKSAKDMWHIGPYLVWPDILAIFAYFLLAVGFVIFGAIKRNKFEAAGWIMLGLVVVGMVAG